MDKILVLIKIMHLSRLHILKPSASYFETSVMVFEDRTLEKKLDEEGGALMTE